MKRWWTRCARVRTRIAPAATGDAELAEADRAHINQCPGCRRRLQELQRLAAGLDEMGRVEAGMRVPPTLRRRWQQAVQATGPAAGSWEDFAGVLPTWIGGRRAWLSLVACWGLILLLRLTAPGVAGPAPARTVIPLSHAMAVLLDVQEAPAEVEAPPPVRGVVPGNDGAALPPGSPITTRAEPGADSTRWGQLRPIQHTFIDGSPRFEGGIS